MITKNQRFARMGRRLRGGLRTQTRRFQHFHHFSPVFRAITRSGKEEASQLSEKQASRNLTELESIYQNVPVGLCFVDCDLRFVKVNQRLAQIHGRPISEHLGRTVREVLGELANILEPIFHRVLETGLPIENIQLHFPVSDKPEVMRHWLVSFYPVKSEKILGVNKVVVDITALKQAEEALRQSEARARRLTDSNLIAVVRVAGDGRILDANDAFLKLMGYTRDELLAGALSWIEMTPSEYLPLALKGLAEAQERGVCTPYENVYMRKDGTRVPILIGYALLEDSRTEYIAFVIDLTESQRAKESHARMAAVVENSADGIISTGPDGMILHWNRAAEQIYGYRAEEMVGRPFSTLEFPEGRENLPALFERVGRGESLRQLERVHRRSDGQRINVSLTISPVRDGAGGLVGFSAISRDITARKRAEHSLQLLAEAGKLLASSIDYRATLRNVAQTAVASLAEACFFDILGKDQKINRIAVALSHPDKDKLMSSAERLIPPPEMRQHPIWKVIRSGRPEFVPHVTEEWMRSISFSEECCELMRDFGLLSFMTVPMTAHGNLLGTLTLCRTDKSRSAFEEEDLAVAEELGRRAGLAFDNARVYEAIRASEARLREAKEQVSHHAHDLERQVAERTASLSQSVQSLEGVLYHVAHDLRSPIRAIQGFTTLLLQSFGGKLNEEGKDYGQRITAAAVRMDGLIEDLLDYGRLGQIELPCRNLNLEMPIVRALGELADEIQTRGAEVQLSRSMPDVWANATALERILIQLLSNALKFVAPGTKPQVHLWAEEKGKVVRLWIEDNGLGIPREFQQRIFHMFERLPDRQEYPGTGIGLAIVRKVAQRMGGQAGVESGLGQGSRFWLELPVVASESRCGGSEEL